MADSEEAGRSVPRTPALAVDGVVLVRRPTGDLRGECSVLLIQRRNEPFKGQWAFPGGFVDYGEDPVTAVGREVAEETGLEGLLFRQFRAYGRPDRDPRGHTVSLVFVAEIVGEAPPVAGGDDAARATWFPLEKLPDLGFDHGQILQEVMSVFRLG